jgi:hypothetical protein
MLEQLLNDPDLVAEVVQDVIDEDGVESGEAMLAHIDRLYTSLLQKRAPSKDRPSSSEQPDQVPCEARHPEEKPALHVPQAPTDADTEGGEDFLTSIDQLYNEVMHVDKLHDTAKADYQASEAASPVTEDTVVTPSPRTLPVDGSEVRELGNVLEEVLWSALMLKRGGNGSLDVQASLLELLPPSCLGQCLVACGLDNLTSSLLQRLSAELPGIHTALTCTSPRLGGGSLNSVASLIVLVREARDRLLILASTSAVETNPDSVATAPRCESGATVPEKAPRKLKVRKTSLSHWTPESLSAMEAPPRRLSQKL